MFIWKNNMLICRSDLRFRKHWGYVKIYPSIDYLYSYLYYDWYLFIFLLLKYHRHYYRIYYYHFLFYPERTFFFPRVTICFLGGFFSKKKPCIEGNCSFETRWTFDAEQCSIKFHIKKSRFLSNSVSFTLLEWVSVRSRLVIKFSLSLPIQKSLQVASGMLWQTSNIVNQNVFMNNEISIL